MAIYDPRYEVAWQLSEEDNDGSLVGVSGADHASRENYESLARFAGLLSGAEVAAVTLCRGEGLIIELTDPPSPWLSRGSFMRAQPSNSPDDEWSVGSLLTGRVRWCWCKPPTGFYSAALIGGPALVASGRLLLVANREGRLGEVNLGLAASYLAQARRLAPGPIADQAAPIAGEGVDHHEGGPARRDQGAGRGARAGAGSVVEPSARPGPGSVAGSVQGSEQATEGTPSRRTEPES